MDNTIEKTRKLKRNWLKLMLELKQNFGRKPNLQSLLFLIGVQEFGDIHRKFSKEEKQDLMHIAVCHLLTKEGYFRYTGKDDEGWPHYAPLKKLPLDMKGLLQQEEFLKERILKYFDKI